MNIRFSFISLALVGLLACNKNEESLPFDQDSILATFDGNIDLRDLPNYANQSVPNYIRKNNTSTNQISDKGAILGRVMFYDKNLSVNNTVSCASCHQQAFAFSDASVASAGVNGSTGRHSMRLINVRFANEVKFFWDERAFDLEDQTTRPIQDHFEMGFSGQDDDPSLDDLITRLEALEYYNELFTNAFGDEAITETRMQLALAQFVSSIQSFDSPYDIGRAQVTTNNANFPNFSTIENQGKTLFTNAPIFNNNGVRTGGGLGCNACHNAPEFDIDPNSKNNGIIGSIGGGLDTEVTRSPTLRDLFNGAGSANGPFMHTGFTTNFEEVLNHYNEIPALGNGLDPRLSPVGKVQRLSMTLEEKTAITAFLKTLTGSAVYTDERWSDPF